MGVGDRGGIRTNELYLSQYLDHFIDESDKSYTVCSRQNQSQGGCFPYLQQGCLDQRLTGYCTDAMDFYGKEYRKTQRIEALYQEPLKKKYQYELSYIGLWTDWLALDQTVKATFYGMFIEHMEQAVKGPLFMERIQSAYEAVDWDSFEGKPVQMVRRSALFGGAYASPEMTEEEIDTWFPKRRMEEFPGGWRVDFLCRRRLGRYPAAGGSQNEGTAHQRLDTGSGISVPAQPVHGDTQGLKSGGAYLCKGAGGNGECHQERF